MTRHRGPGVFRRSSAVRLALVVLLLLIAADATLSACPICFRVEENATTDGVQAAVLVLVGVTTAVLGAFGTFVVRFARREAKTTQIPD